MSCMTSIEIQNWVISKKSLNWFTWQLVSNLLMYIWSWVPYLSLSLSHTHTHTHKKANWWANCKTMLVLEVIGFSNGKERKKERERVLRAPIPISCGTNLAKNTTGAQVQLERERERERWGWGQHYGHSWPNFKLVALATTH